jgi:parallel beta-helix repeat protein
LTAAVLTTAPVSAASSASTSGPGIAKTSPSTKVRTFVVRRLGDFGHGTLRAGFSFANAGPRRSVTIFSFRVRGVIRLSRPLPDLRRATVIDGFSAPSYAGRPVVEVDFNDHPGLFYGPGSEGSLLRGLALDDASGAGVSLYANSISIVANYVGLDLSGRPFANRGDGLYLSRRSADNRIGANNGLVSGAVSNVISANRGSGIVLAGSVRNKIVDNRIGTNPAGTAAMGNRGDGLLLVAGARDNLIGGPVFVDGATGQENNPTGDKGTQTPVFVVPPLGNLISGNGHDGVVVANGSVSNELDGNFIGTTANGDAGLGNAGDGVAIVRANRNSLIGCKFRNNPFVYYNVVSANRGNGLRITDSDDTTVQGNFFGVGANNTTILGNHGNGILVKGTSANTQVGGVIPLGNAAAGNFSNGIAVTGRARGFVTFNTFGGLLPFKGAAPNHHDGLLVTSTGGNNLVRTNVFSGNRGNGIELGGDARGVTIDPDIAGLDTKGTALLPNGGDGLRIDGNAHANVIGGNLHSVIHQNTFSGNRGYGVVITGRAHGNVMFGSFIGTAITGKTALGNGRGGVLIAGFAHGNLIGVHRNLISGNTGNGVTLLGGTFANRIVGNFIGLNKFRQSLPNSERPVVNRGHANIIRGNSTSSGPR